MKRRKGKKMSKEEAVLILEKAGYTAKIENSVVIAKSKSFHRRNSIGFGKFFVKLDIIAVSA